MSYNQNIPNSSAETALIRKTMRLPILSRDAEYALTCAWYYDKNHKALSDLIQSYGKLVVGTAIRFRHYGLPLVDLIQEGNLGLLHAAYRFNPERDVRFSTYSKWWIRAFIQDYVLRNWSIVRSGSTTAHKMLFFKLKRLKSQLSHFSQETLSYEQQIEIAESLNVTLNDVTEMETRLMNCDFSLSTPHTTSEEEWINLLRDEGSTPEEKHSLLEDESMRHEWIDDAMSILTPREVYIILKRRLQDPPDTLECVGIRLNITKERVRQLEVRAIRKMKHRLFNDLPDERDSILES